MKKLSKREKTRIKIMHAAKGLFESYGLDGVTFNQVADAADVCRTTVFNHFGSTSELMLAISSQEIEDVKEYCDENGFEGVEKIKALYGKLIEDLAYYPNLTTRLIYNAVLNSDQENPIKEIEDMTKESLEKAGFKEAENMTVLITGAYFGLTNHYHINNMNFDATTMKDEFNKLLASIIN